MLSSHANISICLDGTTATDNGTIQYFFWRGVCPLNVQTGSASGFHQSAPLFTVRKVLTSSGALNFTINQSATCSRTASAKLPKYPLQTCCEKFWQDGISLSDWELFAFLGTYILPLQISSQGAYRSFIPWYSKAPSTAAVSTESNAFLVYKCHVKRLIILPKYSYF